MWDINKKNLEYEGHKVPKCYFKFIKIRYISSKTKTEKKNHSIFLNDILTNWLFKDETDMLFNTAKKGEIAKLNTLI